jgi:tetratricopeptide (TPR) repeat protein
MKNATTAIHAISLQSYPHQVPSSEQEERTYQINNMGVDIALVAKLNNLGVGRLQTGDLPLAFSTIRDALKYSMGGINNETAAVLANAAVPTGHPQGAENRTWIVQGASTAFVHLNGVQLLPSTTAYSSDVLVSATVTSSILLFNLGLAYHLIALEQPRNVAEMLNKAKSLYEKSCHVLGTIGVGFSSTGSPVVDMVCLANYNNLAQVSYELGAYKESKQFFSRLIRLSSTISSSNYQDPYMAAMVDHQKSSFLLNAVLLSPPMYAAAG